MGYFQGTPKTNSFILAIDFDGVIHDHLNPIKSGKMGRPIIGAEEAMDDLKDAGHTLIIHTVKATTESGKEAVKDWLDYYEIPYNDITAVKPKADYYLDDHALYFDNWQSITNLLGVNDD